MAVLIPIAISLICFTSYIFSIDKYFIMGIVFGAVVGLLLGSIQLYRFMKNYRTITE